MWEFKSEIEIRKKVKESIEQSLNDLEKESTKLDFKLEWYNLKKEKDVFEFIKDTTALVNTVGLDALIIIGYDEKRKLFKDARIVDSKRKATDLNDIINKRVSTFFDLVIYEFDNIEIDGENRVLSVLHIPIFLDKPVVIKGFKNFRQLDKNGNPRIEEHKIFVRKNSSNRPASKYDIDLMYYDRKNIIPEYKVVLSILSLSYNPKDTKIFMQLFVENLGFRTICIKKLSASFTTPYFPLKTVIFTDISSINRLDVGGILVASQLPISSLVINPNSGTYFRINKSINSTEDLTEVLKCWNKESSEWEFQITLAGGKLLSYKIDY